MRNLIFVLPAIIADIHVQSFEDDDVTISWKIEKNEIEITSSFEENFSLLVSIKGKKNGKMQK